VSQKNELERLFVECIEEIRKGIMKRRLKNEIMNKKKYQQIEKNTEEAREFEQSLLKLAELAKNRVKIQDFTNKDKNHLLELFVNNEKTLLKIYEILFPHRAGPNAGHGVSNSMVQESGSGVYGQNTIRALSRGNADINNGSSILNRSIQAQNTNLLNHIQPAYVDYNHEMIRQGGFLPNNLFRTDAGAQGGEHLPNIMGAQKQQTNI
jgi:parvulin-like peptidyl-prolyl isomerase